MIDRPTIAKIMDATKIEEVVSEFVTLKKRGINYVGLCPFHNDSNPSARADINMPIAAIGY